MIDRKKLVTILTPTYNRAPEIKKLYLSLENQTSPNFEWLVVDDGSIDGTEEFFQRIIDTASFPVRFIKKDNGGKHTALNIGFQESKTYFTFIVDSDDVLTPDAIESIIKQLDVVRTNNLSGISFLRGYDPTTQIGKKFVEDYSISNDIDVRIRQNIYGDKAEVWRTDILKQFKFPEFEGERFQGENYVWWQIARQYNMLYINQIIYITEYLEGGLTKSGRLLRIRNPLGGMENCRQAFYKEFPFKTRVKYAILFDAYGFFANWNIVRITRNSTAKVLTVLTLIPGYVLYTVWKSKYMKEKRQ